MKKKNTKKQKRKEARKKPFTASGIQDVRALAEMFGSLIPYSGLGRFNLKTVSRDFKLHKCLPHRHQNKKESMSYFLKQACKSHPIVLKKMIREILPKAVEKRHKEGAPILAGEAELFAQQLFKIGLDLRREIRDLNLPISRPTIVPPPFDAQEILKKFKLHPFLIPDCQKMFLDGHINESVRKALEKYEVYVVGKSGLTLKGKDLMAKAFSSNNPTIKLSLQQTESEKNEQEGYMLLSMGIMQWWRNTLSHGDESQISHHEAIGRLFLVSNLLHRLDEIR